MTGNTGRTVPPRPVDCRSQARNDRGRRNTHCPRQSPPASCPPLFRASSFNSWTRSNCRWFWMGPTSWPDPGHRPLWRCRASSTSVGKRCVDRLVRIDALHGHADLSAVDGGSEEQLLRYCGDVDVFQHDGRIVAAQLQRHALQRAGATGHDLLAGGHRSGKGDLVDARVRGEHGAQFIAAGQYGQDPGGRMSPRISPMRSVVSGVNGEGLMMAQLPVYSAEARGPAARFTGAFHGVMIPATPSGT